MVSFIDYIPDLLPILFFLYLNCLKMYHYLEINHYILRNEKHLSYKGRSLILLSQHGPTFIATGEQVTGKKKRPIRDTLEPGDIYACLSSSDDLIVEMFMLLFT